MADNFLYIPELNPVAFYDINRSTLPKYFTKHFEYFMFEERLYQWQQRESYVQIWQTTDIINLQFESTFDPIIVKLVDSYGITRITLPALIGIPNVYLPNTYTFEVSMSLSGLASGCYRLIIEAGSGDTMKTLISDRMFISDVQIKNSICLEYWNSNFNKDVVFETGIKFQMRVHGHFGFLEKQRSDEVYKDQKFTTTLLNSKSAKRWKVYFGDSYGLPDDIINLIDEIWSCDNVLIDAKPFCIADGASLEYVDSEYYPKRGISLDVEEGINRNSRVYGINTDTNKKLITSIIVDARVFGDTGNQGSANTVPVHNISNE